VGRRLAQADNAYPILVFWIRVSMNQHEAFPANDADGVVSVFAVFESVINDDAKPIVQNLQGNRVKGSKLRQGLLF
jgi:hypothetical protein